MDSILSFISGLLPNPLVTSGMNIILIIIGTIITYLSAILRYVPPPYKWVVEMNFPQCETKKIIWEQGLHFLWLPIRPFMFVRNKLFCADKKILVTIGIEDENPGNPSLVEFKDTSAAVRTQIVFKVTDPIKATYEVDDYEEASLNKVEADFRKLMSNQRLDDAMGNIDVRSDVAKKTFDSANKAIERWGVELTNEGAEITIIEFVLQQTTLDERAKVLKAEKDAVAKVMAAKATRAATILEKEGEAKGIQLVKKAEGKGEADKIKFLFQYLNKANTGPVDIALTLDYLLKSGMLKAIDGSTIIATSEGGLLNTPISLAQTMFAIDSARASQSGGGNP